MENNINNISNIKNIKTIKTYKSNNEKDTFKIAKIVVKYLINEKLEQIENCEDTNKNINIILKGDLGAGKTKFVTGMLSEFNKQNEASSPTFTIVNEYNNIGKLKINAKDRKTKKEKEININLNHFDVYRLNDEDEFFESGLEEYLHSEENLNINVFEWGELISGVFEKPYYLIEINKKTDSNGINIINERQININLVT